MEEQKKISIGFLGSSDFAIPVLDALRKDPLIEIRTIGTQVDKPAGRKKILTPTAFGKWCDEQGISCERIVSVNAPEYLEKLRNLAPEILVVVAFGQLLKEEILNLPPCGCLNVHGSILPKYRGASPIASAILAGETECGVCFMKMDKGLDTGGVYETLKMPLEENVTKAELSDALARLAAGKIGECLRKVVSGECQAVEQDHSLATVSKKIRKSDGYLRWTEDARLLARKVHAFYPWPATVCTLELPNRKMLVKILAGRFAGTEGGGNPGVILEVGKQTITVSCGNGSLLIERVVPEGKKEMSAADFARGFRLVPGAVLSDGPEIAVQ